jgi:hypothetical protein
MSVRSERERRPEQVREGDKKDKSVQVRKEAPNNAKSRQDSKARKSKSCPIGIIFPWRNFSPYEMNAFYVPSEVLVINIRPSTAFGGDHDFDSHSTDRCVSLRLRLRLRPYRSSSGKGRMDESMNE